jgi:hypothetical protein
MVLHSTSLTAANLTGKLSHVALVTARFIVPQQLFTSAKPFN